MHSYDIVNGRIVLRDSVLDDHVLVVRDATIADIASERPRGAQCEAVDARGGYVTPGLVEMHIHGCGGIGLETDALGKVAKVSSFLRARGINTVVPTLQCNEAALKRVAAEIGAAGHEPTFVPGVYVEGPFVNPQRKGGINPDHITAPEPAVLEKVLGALDGTLKMMTVAPELPDILPLVDRLQEDNVIVCLGHSDCEIEQAEALARDRTIGMTHLFNAMSGISHRKPGLAMLPFVRRDTWFELNGDGIHLSAESIRMCAQSLNPERMILISDAVVAAGTDGGEFTYFGKPLTCDERGVRYADSDILIGSHMLMNDIVRNFVALTGTTVHQAVRAATHNPCCLLGIDKVRGSIEPGKLADVVIFDEQFNLIRNLVDP